MTDAGTGSLGYLEDSVRVKETGFSWLGLAWLMTNKEWTVGCDANKVRLIIFPDRAVHQVAAIINNVYD